MNYKDFNLGDWIGHISGAIEDERELDGNEMRDLVEFLSKLEQEPKTGEWQQDFDGTYLCSECGSGFKEQPTLMGKPMFLWCPLCGCRMVKTQGSEGKK